MSELLKDGGFWRKNSENAFFRPKMVESKNEWYQKVLLKSFPMSGHVRGFNNLKCFGNSW
jgi:hypothetical protein